MKKTNLPQEMYAVAVVTGGVVYGQIYGPYNRIQDAEKALERLNKGVDAEVGYEIIHSRLKWESYISGGSL